MCHSLERGQGPCRAPASAPATNTVMVVGLVTNNIASPMALLATTAHFFISSSLREEATAAVHHFIVIERHVCMD